MKALASLLSLSLILATALPLQAADPVPYRVPEDLHPLAMKGLRNMYALEFEAAEETFEEMTRLRPEHPAGYVFLTGLRWWIRSQRFDVAKADKTLKKRFFEVGMKAADIAKKRKAWGGTKDEMHFYRGMALGVIGRWHATHYNWLRAYYWGKKANRHLLKAIKANPGYYDAYLGPGIFDYYSATLPGILKIAALMFIRGDKDRGLEWIRKTMDQGLYNKIEAELFLIGVMNETERKPETAARMASDLAERFPENQFFRLVELFTVLRAKRWEEVIAKSDALMKAVEASGTPSMRAQVSLLHLYKANAAFALEDYPRAVAHAAAGIEASPDPDRGWVTYCMLRRAMARDLLGERELAVEEYRKVLKRDEFWFEHRDAKRGIRKPYTHEKVLALILE